MEHWRSERMLVLSACQADFSRCAGERHRPHAPHLWHAGSGHGSDSATPLTTLAPEPKMRAEPTG